VKDRKKEKFQKHHVLNSFSAIKKTFKMVANYKETTQFLIARLFYNDGLVTVFALGGIYAVGTLDFTFDEVMKLGIVLNIAAGFGAFVFGYIEDKVGVKKVINLTLGVLLFCNFNCNLCARNRLSKGIILDCRSFNWFDGWSKSIL
jgi:MFS-type transporter involved in bile tolerance (Atg22 family)